VRQEITCWIQEPKICYICVFVRDLGDLLRISLAYTSVKISMKRRERSILGGVRQEITRSTQEPKICYICVLVRDIGDLF
jgi:hypothetical protein